MVAVLGRTLNCKASIAWSNSFKTLDELALAEIIDSPSAGNSEVGTDNCWAFLGRPLRTCLGRESEVEASKTL